MKSDPCPAPTNGTSLGASPVLRSPDAPFGFRISGFLRTSGFGFRISRSPRAAFSLLEVMIAGGIFFMAIFAILGLVSGTLRNARALRRVDVDAGMVAAQVCNTNKLYEGASSGDFGNLYPDYSWETYTSEVATNHLFQVDIVVHRRGLQQPVDKMSIFFYAPDSPSSGFGRPTFR